MGDVPFTSIGSELHPGNAGHSLTSMHRNNIVHYISMDVMCILAH